MSEDELLMSLPAMTADGAVLSGMTSAPSPGLGAGRLGADDAGDRADAMPPELQEELQAAPDEDEEVHRATAAGLQAAVVVAPLDSEELSQ